MDIDSLSRGYKKPYFSIEDVEKIREVFRSENRDYLFAIAEYLEIENWRDLVSLSEFEENGLGVLIDFVKEIKINPIYKRFEIDIFDFEGSIPRNLDSLVKNLNEWKDLKTEEEKTIWLFKRDERFNFVNKALFERYKVRLNDFFDREGNPSQFFYELFLADSIFTQGGDGKFVFDSYRNRYESIMKFDDNELEKMSPNIRLIFGLFKNSSSILPLKHFLWNFLNKDGVLNTGKERLFNFGRMEDYIKEVEVWGSDDKGRRVMEKKYVATEKLLELMLEEIEQNQDYRWNFYFEGLINDVTLENLPENKRDFWRCFMDDKVNDFKSFIYRNRENYQDFFTDGVLNVRFFEEYRLGNFIDGLSQLLSSEVLNKMENESARKYWLFYRDYAVVIGVTSIKDFLENRVIKNTGDKFYFDYNSLIENYFEEVEGRIIPNFRYIEELGLEIVNRNEIEIIPVLLDFLTNEILEKIEDEKARAFWRYFKEVLSKDIDDNASIQNVISIRGDVFRQFLLRKINEVDGEGGHFFDYDSLSNDDSYFRIIDDHRNIKIIPTVNLFGELMDNFGLSLFIDNILTDEVLGEMNEKDRELWSFIRRESNTDLKRYLWNNRDKYVREGQNFNESELRTDFIEETVIRPQNCRTYESLTNLFNRLRELTDSDRIDLTGIYMKIAVNHRLGRMVIAGNSTEVEQLRALGESFAQLYREDMDDEEKMAWKILQRQLPLTIGSDMGRMRNQALVVERLNRRLLSWVHQSVHNHASIHEVDYLESFREYLVSGDDEKFNENKQYYAGNFRAPDYTKEQYEALRNIPNLVEELDKLIMFAKNFYRINSDLIKSQISRLNLELEDNDPLARQLDLVNNLIEDIDNLSEMEAINNQEDKDMILDFCLKVGLIREELMMLCPNQDYDREIKSRIVNIDAALESYSSKMFILYTDYIKDKETLSTVELTESILVLRELCRSALINGELPENTRSFIKTFTVVSGQQVYDAPLLRELHAKLLKMIEFENKMEGYWRDFISRTRDKMILSAMENGLTEDEARGRVEFEELVDFRKTSVLFLLDPLLEEVMKKVKMLEEGDEPTLQQTYEEFLGGNLLSKEEREYPQEVQEFTDKLGKRNLFGNMDDDARFLGSLRDMSETRADRLIKYELREYRENRRYMKILKNGKKVEFYPISYYGCDMTVVLIDGKRVDDPFKLLAKLFNSPKALVNAAKRDGD